MILSRNVVKLQVSLRKPIHYKAHVSRGVTLPQHAHRSLRLSKDLAARGLYRTPSSFRVCYATEIAHKHEKPSVTKDTNLVRDAAALAYLIVVFLLPSVYFGYATLFVVADIFSQLKMDPPKDMTAVREADLQQVTPEVAHVPAQSTALKANNGFYRPLTYKEEIRLLVLDQGVFGDDVSFHLEHIKLGHDNVAYEALSYAWGSSTDSQILPAVPGPCPPVSPNLLSALRHLRYPDRPRRLWIDALCIDQSDLEERGQQVRLMGSIFSKADRVVVWLGEEYERSDRAFLSLMHFYDRSWKSRFWHVTWFKKEGGKAIRRRFVARTAGQLFASMLGGGDGWTLDNFDIEEMDWSAIRSLLQRSWFHRLWVVQEVSHAQRAIILCGHTEVAWSSFSAALIYLVENDLAMYLDPVCAAACDSVAGIERMRSRKTQDSLFDVALDNTYGGCTDSRDKLFAMMSMAKGRDAFDWEVSLDYTLTAEELYKRFAIWDIVRNRTLRVLSCASVTSKDPELMPSVPTWVPDWTRILTRHLLVRANATSMFSAGLSKGMVVWFSNDKSLVHVEGAVIDSIEVVGSEPCSLKTTSLFEIDRPTMDRFKSLYFWLAECWYIAGNGNHMTAGAYDAFWRTMVCGLDGTGRPAPEIYSRYFLSYITFLAEAHQILGAVLDDPYPLDVSGPSLSRRLHKQAASFGMLPKRFQRGTQKFHLWFETNLQVSTPIEDSLQKWGAGKRFSRTLAGRLARVPSNAVHTDLICILHGSEVPYVVRLQEDRTYIVIGECYVHDIMHGEALQLPDYEPQILRLR